MIFANRCISGIRQWTTLSIAQTRNVVFMAAKCSALPDFRFKRAKLVVNNAPNDFIVLHRDRSTLEGCKVPANGIRIAAHPPIETTEHQSISLS
jgi:hypothetical protein